MTSTVTTISTTAIETTIEMVVNQVGVEVEAEDAGEEERLDQRDQVVMFLIPYKIICDQLEKINC